MQKLPATAAQSAVVALAGPVVGGVAAGATAFAGRRDRLAAIDGARGLGLHDQPVQFVAYWRPGRR